MPIHPDIQHQLDREAMETQVGKILAATYPNRDWYVDSSEDLTTIDIRCLSISAKYGMIIHTNKSMLEMDKRVKEAAGELLERFKLSRMKFAQGDEQALNRDIAGEVIGAKQGEYTG